MSDAIEKLAQALQNQRSVALATIVDVQGASPAKVGAQLVLLPDGETAGTGQTFHLTNRWNDI